MLAYAAAALPLLMLFTQSGLGFGTGFNHQTVPAGVVEEAEELGYEPFKSGPQRVLMGEAEIAAALCQMGGQIVADCRELGRLLILGVRGAGSQLAQRLAHSSSRRATRRR